MEMIYFANEQALIARAQSSLSAAGEVMASL